MTNQTKLFTTILLVLAVLSGITLQWSKCPVNLCKACSNKGCIKCFNRWTNYNYECKEISGNTIANCLHEYEVTIPNNPPPGNTVVKRCRVCGHGFRVGENLVTCVAIGNSNCYAGSYNTVRI